MHLTKEQILQDPYISCEEYNADPETATEADRLFCQASQRLAAYKVYGEYKPVAEAIILDIWDFFQDHERQIMQEANHPFYQAWAEITALQG